MKKKIVMIATVVVCLTSFVSPVLAKGGHHGGFGHSQSHGVSSRGGRGGKGGGNSDDTLSTILGIVRDVVDR